MDRCSGLIGWLDSNRTFSFESLEVTEQRTCEFFDTGRTQSKACRSLSTENGGSEHQPWLLTVFQKEKSAGVEIVIELVMSEGVPILLSIGQYRETSKERQNAIFKISS